LKKKAFVSAGK